MKLEDLSGRRFGRLEVLYRVGDNVDSKDRHARWRCFCDCGQSKIISAHNLTTGNTKSCGCLRAENIQKHKFKEQQK